MIQDNGYTLTMRKEPILVEAPANNSGIVRFTGSLSQIHDWLEAALKEVDDMIVAVS